MADHRRRMSVSLKSLEQSISNSRVNIQIVTDMVAELFVQFREKLDVIVCCGIIIILFMT